MSKFSLEKLKKVFECIAVCVVAILIPVVLICNVIFSNRYESLESEVAALEKKQEELVEKNKKLVSDISVLTSAEMIERRATTELGMKKAEKDDIVRVEIGNGK